MEHKILSDINQILKTQGMDGNWNQSEYMRGLYNGMEMIVAIVEKREPVFKLTEEGNQK